jgi:hypothetical protein
MFYLKELYLPFEAHTLLLNEIFKKGALIAVESDVLSIYIVGRGKRTALYSPFLKTSLIIRTLFISVLLTVVF